MEDGSKNAVRKGLLWLCLLGQFLVVSVRQGKAAAAETSGTSFAIITFQTGRCGTQCYCGTQRPGKTDLELTEIHLHKTLLEGNQTKQSCSFTGS